MRRSRFNVCIYILSLKKQRYTLRYIQSGSHQTHTYRLASPAAATQRVTSHKRDDWHQAFRTLPLKVEEVMHLQLFSVSVRFVWGYIIYTKTYIYWLCEFTEYHIMFHVFWFTTRRKTLVDFLRRVWSHLVRQAEEYTREHMVSSAVMQEVLKWI